MFCVPRPHFLDQFDFLVQTRVIDAETFLYLLTGCYFPTKPVSFLWISYKAEDVVATLDEVCGKIGYLSTIRVYDGSEFISRDLDLWAYVNKVTLDFSRPGKQTDNAFIEAFNSKFQQE